MKTDHSKRSVFLKLIAHREQRRFRVLQVDLISTEMNKATMSIICSWSPGLIQSSTLRTGSGCRFSN